MSVSGPSFLLLLPSELKHRIAELSSKDTLASLARTHTAFQIEAEQALYRSLSNPSFKCLETLAMNPEKAGFVHFLTMECFRQKKRKKKGNDDHRREMIEFLLNALVNMHCLSDFRLRFLRAHELEPWIESLDKILCDNHFQLQALCCDEALNLSRIITSQTELRKLGIYENYGNDFGFLGNLKQLQSAQLHLPVVFTLEYGFYELDDLYSVSIFPALNDCHPTLHRVLAESFNTTLVDARFIYGLSIYLVDSCDLPSIQVLTKNMVTTFPSITSLTFSFENPCEKIPSQEIKEIIPLFPSLSKLDIEVWPPLDIGNGNISGAVKRAHEALVKDWELVCPELVSVSFIDGSTLEKDDNEWFFTDGGF